MPTEEPPTNSELELRTALGLDENERYESAVPGEISEWLRTRRLILQSLYRGKNADDAEMIVLARELQEALANGDHDLPEAFGDENDPF